MNEKELEAWCVQQAKDRRDGKLSEEQIKKLDDIQFPWGAYELMII